MRRTLPILLALLSAAIFLASGKVPADALGPVQYEVRYQLGTIVTKVADATISLENDHWEGQAALHAHASIHAYSIFRLFMAPEYTADAYLTPGGPEPLYYINPIKKGGREGKFECTYDRSAHQIKTCFAKPPAEPVEGEFPLDGRTMDLLSLLQYVRFSDLRTGNSQSMHLLIGGKSIAATLTCEGNDTERFAGVAAERFHVGMKERGLMENGSGKELTVWRAAGGDRRILGLETALSASGTMIVEVKD